ncbi:MAG: 2-oxoglutarate and iron-dependent oxygenase domain-containing protein [Thermostichus sp. HHBFW_bins_43]
MFPISPPWSFSSQQTGIPCLDITPFREGTDPLGVAKAFGKALEQVGFVIITGHGIPEEIIQAAYDKVLAFYDLPLAQKMAVTIPDRVKNRGYLPIGIESVAATRGAEVPHGDPPGRAAHDLCEALVFNNLFREDPNAPQGGEDPDSGNLWPTEPQGLRAALLAYDAGLRQLTETLMRIGALALDLPETYFLPFMEGKGGVLRAVHYPEQEKEPIPGQLRYGAHSDYGGFTLLRQDGAPGGLQVYSSQGEWIDVQAIPRSFVINIGDLLARWTNDRWRSTLHRVVNPPREAFGASRRLSLVYFTAPRDDAWIECLPTCQDADNPPRYAPVRAGDYVRAKLDISMSGEQTKVREGG